MSIFLVGNFQNADEEYFWRGVWQFTKEAKPGFPFVYRVRFQVIDFSQSSRSFAFTISANI